MDFPHSECTSVYDYTLNKTYGKLLNYFIVLFLNLERILSLC